MAPDASSTAPAASSSTSEGYSPLLRIGMSLSGRNHIVMPDGLTACRRRLADTQLYDMRTYVDQFGDGYICSRCKGSLGAYQKSSKVS